MRPDQRVVTTLPLSELSDVTGPVPARRGRRLGTPEITQLLRAGPVQFVVANLGPLRWVPIAEAYSFWKAEVKPRVVRAEAEKFSHEDYPGAYCYVASE